MPDLTTDPEMMRAQQNKDTKQHISDDETRETLNVGDTDPASGKAREAAKSGEARFDEKRLDAVFQDNDPDKRRPGEGSRQSDDDLAENNVRSQKGETGLADPGRSRLGD